MPTASLHDGAPLEVAVLGTGPTVLLPVRTTVVEGEEADRMRAWGADPNLGHALATGLAEAGFQVVAADYEGHLAQHPKPHTLTADTVAADLLAVGDAAGAQRFAYYGYSWLALAGLQLALRTDRLTALAMGGFPPLGGPYRAMLTVTRAAHRMAEANQNRPPAAADGGRPGDWDSVEVSVSVDQARQYVTLYESLQDFDEAEALGRLTLPRLAFAGADDDITYGPKWGDVEVRIASALAEHRDTLAHQGWTVELLPGKDHMTAMQAAAVLPVLVPWLTGVLVR